MSNRVKKTKSGSDASTLRANHLLMAILSATDLVTMRPCSACEARSIPLYEVSETESSRYAECVRSKRSGCDVLGVSPSQLRTIASQHQKLENELMEAEERVLRLRKQKKLWFEKMMRAISRGIDSVEELERVEREEAKAAAQAEAAIAAQAVASSNAAPATTTPSRLSSDFGDPWDAVYPEVPLESSLLADFGVVSGPSFLERRDTAGRTPVVSPGSEGA